MTPRQLAEALLDAYNRRDIAALARLIDDDVDYTRMGGSRAASKADVVAAYEATFAGDFVFELLRATEEGEVVVIEIVGRQQKPPHKVIQANDYHRWHNGKLVEYRAYVDTMDG